MAEAERLIRNVRVAGRGLCDVHLRNGLISGIGRDLPRCNEELDGAGGVLIPGLHDHHIHLLATAARFDTVDLSDASGPGEAQAAIRAASDRSTPGAWIRIAGFHAHTCGHIDLALLDQLAPRNPVRLEHQTGALWILNSLALERLGVDEAPPGLERDEFGKPTGQLWRGDAWLRERLGVVVPNLAALGRRLAACGVTGVTDTSPTTDHSAFALLAEANASGALPQKLLLMSGGSLVVAETPSVRLGPMKVLLDDHDLPDVEHLAAFIREAHSQRRGVAIHCVTYGELAIALAAWESAGIRPGDRVEHGGQIARETVPQLARLGLCVVTQPGFISERGDRYLETVPPDEWSDLYRCGSLLAEGVKLAGSSDAPYGNIDPWAGMRAAVARRTRRGRQIGAAEGISASAALDLYLGPLDRPGQPSRGLYPGGAADLVLLMGDAQNRVEDLDAAQVRATMIDGELVYLATDGC